MAVNHEDLTTNHVPHTDTYANQAARLAASGFVSGDVGKLYVQSDARRKLYRLTTTDPSWDALVPTGKNVIWVDPKGEGDYALLSDALDAIVDGAVDNQYLILVSGVVEETAQVVGKSYVHVQGLAGASIQVTPSTPQPGVYLHGMTKSTWQDLDIQCLGANALQAVKLDDCDTTVRIKGCNTTTDTSSSLAIDVISGEASIEMSKGVPQANWIADAQGAFGTSRDGEARTWAAIVTGQTSGATTVELVTLQADRLVLPNLATWMFEGHCVARNGNTVAESAAYQFSGVIRRGATAGATALIAAVTPTVLGEDVAGWDLTVTADATNGALKIEGTGASGDSINWVCTVFITQVLVVVT